jgi:hypothetical protein
MKTLWIALFFLFITGYANAQKTKSPVLTKASFEVNGVCGMCKTNIEKAAKKAGVAKAVWDLDSHLLSVAFNEKKTSVKNIQEKVAAAGYDNTGATSTGSAYEKLHACCKYDRVKMEEKNIQNQTGNK